MSSFRLAIIVFCSVLMLGCKHTENPPAETQSSGNGSVKVFPLNNKMMYQKTDADYVSAVSLTFANRAPVYVKMLPRYTHKVVINTGSQESSWLYSEAGFVQLADKPNTKIYKINKPELITELFYNK